MKSTSTSVLKVVPFTNTSKVNDPVWGRRLRSLSFNAPTSLCVFTARSPNLPVVTPYTCTVVLPWFHQVHFKRSALPAELETRAGNSRMRADGDYFAQLSSVVKNRPA